MDDLPLDPMNVEAEIIKQMMNYLMSDHGTCDYGNYLYGAGEQVASTSRGIPGNSSNGSIAAMPLLIIITEILARRNRMQPHFGILERDFSPTAKCKCQLCGNVFFQSFFFCVGYYHPRR